MGKYEIAYNDIWLQARTIAQIDRVFCYVVDHACDHICLITSQSLEEITIRAEAHPLLPGHVLWLKVWIALDVFRQFEIRRIMHSLLDVVREPLAQLDHCPSEPEPFPSDQCVRPRLW